MSLSSPTFTDCRLGQIAVGILFLSEAGHGADCRIYKYDNTLHYKLSSLSRLMYHHISSCLLRKLVQDLVVGSAFPFRRCHRVGRIADLAGNGLGLGGGTGDGIGGGDRVHAPPEPVGLSNL